jgi:hypothetical protein
MGATFADGAAGLGRIHELRRLRHPHPPHEAHLCSTQARVLIEALKPGEGTLYEIDASPAGLMLLLRLPAGVSDEDTVRTLETHGIETQALSGHYAGRKPQQGLLLSFAGFSDADLEKAARNVDRGSVMTDAARATAFAWVEANHARWSAWNSHIWHLAETAWREYRSAEWYVKTLRAEGFTVEEGSGGMPTAFSATWSNGQAPLSWPMPNMMRCRATARRRTLMAPAAQGPVTLRRRPYRSAFGAGHGLARRSTCREGGDGAHGITGTIRFMGEPAEKVRGSKPIHAAKGYYDGLDAIISFHPFYMLPLCNTARWDTHCGPYYAAIYEFLCERPQDMARRGPSPMRRERPFRRRTHRPVHRARMMPSS